jgi:hypothetical protein
LLAVLECYGDESESSRRERVFVTAAWFGEGREWRKFERRWEGILRQNKLKEFKACDCAQGNGEFANRKQWPQRRRGALVYRLLRIIKETRIRAAVSVVFVPALGGRMRPRLDYNATAVLCMANAALYVDATYPEGERIAFMFDERGKGKDELEVMRRYLRSHWSAGKRIGPATFDDSALVVPLQAADFLAYEAHRVYTKMLETDPPRRGAVSDIWIALSPQIIGLRSLMWSPSDGLEDLSDAAT